MVLMHVTQTLDWWDNLYALPTTMILQGGPKNATLGIGFGYYSKKYATTLILIR